MTTDSNDTQYGYVLFQIEITDRERYMNGYIPSALESVEAHGGRVLVGADDPTILEGDWPYNWTVVLEFPSVQDAQAWYDSDAYEAVRPVRHGASSAEHVALVHQFAPE